VTRTRSALLTLARRWTKGSSVPKKIGTSKDLLCRRSAKDFFDNSLLQELEQEGFAKKLGK
jgi:hypothetical protein